MTFVQSRFAVLKVENDEDEKAAQRARDKQKAKEMNNVGKKLQDGKQKLVVAEKNATKKKKASQEKAELKNLAFGLGKPVKSSSSKKSKKAPNGAPRAAEPTEEWQQRDANLIEEDFEAQLQQALIASKVEYQKKKELYQAHQLEMAQLEQETTSSNANKKSKKGTTTMSLDQFNQVPLVSVKQSAQPSASMNGKIVTTNEEDQHFFEKVLEEAKLLANREKRQAQAANKSALKSKQPTEAPRMAQLLEEFKQSQEEVDNLRHENETLREELTALKTKSKRMCAVLLQGEMKEKAELIIEMEKLTKVKDELTAEVEKLSSELQQERSKVSALSDAKKNAAQKKKADGEK